ncbi:MAG: hypothetical protein AB7R89_23075 [Dehalococcoidia bacterium]
MDGRNSQNHDNTGATITAEDYGNTRILTIDCKHATTTIALIAAAGVVDDVTGVRLGLIKHYAEEGCRCTRHLRRRYGVAVA